MRKIYLFFQDYKRVWTYSLVLMISLFFVMVCISYVFEELLKVTYYCDRFNVEEYGDSRILHIDPDKMSLTDKEYLYNEIVENDYGYSLFTETTIKTSIPRAGNKAQLNFVPPWLIDFYNINYTGEWFSGNVGKVKEAMVPYYLHDEFELGKEYEFSSSVKWEKLFQKDFKHNVKIIGYIYGYKNDKYVIRNEFEYTSPTMYLYNYNTVGDISNIIICDDQMINQYTPEEFFSCYYTADSLIMSNDDALRWDSLKYATADEKTYIEFYQSSNDYYKGRERGFKLVSALIMVFLTLLMVGSTIVKNEHVMRRQASSYIVGDSSTRNIASEIGISLVTFLLPCLIFIGTNFLFMYTDKLLILFSVSIGMFVIYTVITAISLFVKFRKKPIDIIKRQ